MSRRAVRDWGCSLGLYPCLSSLCISLAPWIRHALFLLLKADRYSLDKGLERPGTHNRIPFLSLWPLYAPVRCESNKKVYSHYTRGEHEADKVSDAQPKLDHICFEIKRIVHTDPSPLSPGGKTEGPSFFRSRMSKDLSSSHSSEQKQLCFLPVSSSEIT